MKCPRLDLLKTINDLNKALDYCEANCHKYYTCDDVMIMNDKLVESELNMNDWINRIKQFIKITNVFFP